MTTPQVISIQIGLPKSFGLTNAVDPMDRSWTTGFFKLPVENPIWLGTNNLVGDGQADLKHHGGLEKALLAYASMHYLDWQKSLQLPMLPYGAFGENITVQNQSESSVCIGDIYQFGDSSIQVSQPRQPCWKISRRWRIHDLALQVQNSGKTGWYFRVIKEGYVEPSLPLILCERPFPEWTITKANQIMHNGLTDLDLMAELASCPLLAINWKTTLAKRLKKGITEDSNPRIWGTI
jgi:MOSC domain-containing protein YiiM